MANTPSAKKRVRNTQHKTEVNKSRRSRIKTFVKKGASIFAASTVLGNITIGENSIVAAGSLVLKDVEKNSTVAGVPAKELKIK